MGSVNIPAKFEVRSFTCSCDNRGTQKNLVSPWIPPRSLFSHIFNGLLFKWTLWMYLPSSKPPLPQDWGFATHPKTAIAIIARTPKATDCKFGWYIYRVHPNTSPWKILEKSGRGRIQWRPKFFEYPLLSQERVKLWSSNLAGIFRGSMQTKVH